MSIPSAIQSKNRADLSQFLIHLTKNGTYGNLEKVTTFKVHGYREVDIPVKAQDSLQKMVVNRKIEARGSFGYYRLKVNMYKYYHNTGYENVFANGYAEPSWLKAVCFSETPLSELKSFYDAVIEKRLAFEKKNKYQKYGLAFHQENVRMAGGNPIFYVDSRRDDLKKVMDKNYENNLNELIPMMHLFEGFGPLYLKNAYGYSDFRWEREWRMPGDFNFKCSDVAFGICPNDEIKDFEKLAENEIVFIDPDWDKDTLKRYLQIKNPQLIDQL